MCLKMFLTTAFESSFNLALSLRRENSHTISKTMLKDARLGMTVPILKSEKQV